ncbi:MAG: hypothetical protein P8K08_09510 [Fuerstiella sp.]|nr:hypothetical protein [Fuerstiella sp.]
MSTPTMVAERTAPGLRNLKQNESIGRFAPVSFAGDHQIGRPECFRHFATGIDVRRLPHQRGNSQTDFPADHTNGDLT